MLVSKLPLEKIKTVGLDTSSLTSVALTKVLFEKWWGGARQFVPQHPNLEEMLRQCDAGLLIGDPALQVDRSRYVTFDLAEEWIRFTSKPFVFAFWAIRQDDFRLLDHLICRRFFKSHAITGCSRETSIKSAPNGRRESASRNKPLMLT